MPARATARPRACRRRCWRLRPDCTCRTGARAPPWSTSPPAGSNKDTAAALRLDDVRTRFLEQGAEPQGQSPQATAAFIKEEEARWRAVIKSANVTLE